MSIDQSCNGRCWLQYYTKGSFVYEKDPSAEWCGCTLFVCDSCGGEVPGLLNSGVCKNCSDDVEIELNAVLYRHSRKARAERYFKAKKQAKCKHRWEHCEDDRFEWFLCNKCYKVDFNRVKL